MSTPRSSIKRPRPVKRAPSSTRSIERPTHEPSGNGSTRDVLADCSIPMVLAAAFFGTRFRPLFGDLAENGHTVRSHNLPTSLISHAASQYEYTSVGQPRSRAEFAGADTGMVAKKPREMRRNIESQLRANRGNVSVVVYDSRDCALQPHDVEIDSRWNADGGLESPEEMRPRQAGFLR